MSTTQTTTTDTVSPKPLVLNLHANYPYLRARLARGVELYRAGKVNLAGAFDMIAVESLDGARSYLVAPDLSSCSCPDHSTRGVAQCKHILASGLCLASHELAARKLPTLVKVLRTQARAA